ncbi:hypothetical protein AE925_16665 [Xanthomonas arboricola]|nr:hypothetical protein AE925_16665 [Xanthomonas arboricola]KOB42465.1 hypothetical protein AE931_16935 [Xanthomonas arboricola]
MATCGTRDQVGIICYVCQQGLFMPQHLWQLSRCPDCHAESTFCTSCRNKGWVATPAHDVELDELRQIWSAAEARYLSNDHVVPEALANWRGWLGDASE